MKLKQRYTPSGTPAAECVVHDCADCPLRSGVRCGVTGGTVDLPWSGPRVPFACPLRRKDLVVRLTRNRGHPPPREEKRLTFPGVVRKIRAEREKD